MFEDALRHAFEQQDRQRFDQYLKRLRISVKTAEILVDDFVEVHHPRFDWETRVDRIRIKSVVDNVTTALKSENFTTENYEFDYETSENIIKRMLESMGSRISIESRFGEGSIFSVYFKEKLY